GPARRRPGAQPGGHPAAAGGPGRRRPGGRRARHARAPGGPGLRAVDRPVRARRRDATGRHPRPRRMMGIAAVLVALLGVPAGMFANLLIDRVPEKQPLWPLPAVGSLIGGRRHGLVVVATAALFAGTVLRFRGDWVVPAYLVFF